MATSVDDQDTPSSGLKRKRDAGPKFYAVRVGHKPGIYHSWQDCLLQIRGFKGATCLFTSNFTLKKCIDAGLVKSFPSLTEAEAFLNADINSPTSATVGTPTKFYAVANGHRPGIYTDWPSAQKQITGWQKPKHKSFTTHAEAEAWLKQTQAGANNSPTTASSANGTHSAKDASPAAKRVKTTDGFTSINGTTTSSEFPEPGTDPLPADAEDGFDSRIVLDQDTGKLRWKTQAELSQTRPQARIDNVNDTIYIYTDGACRANGQSGAVAGVGVFFGKDDPRYVVGFYHGQPLPYQYNFLGTLIPSDMHMQSPFWERLHTPAAGGVRILSPWTLPTVELSPTMSITDPNWLNPSHLYHFVTNLDPHRGLQSRRQTPINVTPEQRRLARMMLMLRGYALPVTFPDYGDELYIRLYTTLGWLPNKSNRNLSEPLPGARQTNQRAELTALKRALDITPLNRNVHIFSDSSYAIKCVTEWFVQWRNNNWKTSSKKNVENRDIVEEILARIEEREQVRVKTRFEWVKGHEGSAGNCEADRLAVEGALDARRRGMGGGEGEDGEDEDAVVVDEDEGTVNASS